MSKVSTDNKDFSIEKDQKKVLEKMVQVYLESNHILSNGYKSSELEVWFSKTADINSKPITKINYENVVKSLYKNGFICNNTDGTQYLRIVNEYIDPKTGDTVMSNVRAEIEGLFLIQEYCKTNSIQKLIDLKPVGNINKENVKFTKKFPMYDKNSEVLKNAEFPDLNFSVCYKIEKDFGIHDKISQNIIAKWMDSKKIFRYINRVRFTHPTLPLHADISIVKTNRKVKGKVVVPQYTIQDAKVFTNIEHYELELEIDNTRVGLGTEYNTAEKVIAVIRKGVRFILSGLQETNYPITNRETNQVLDDYMRLVHGETYEPRTVTPYDFIGPSSYTLQVENIVENTEGSYIPNIRNNYTVTDKADGQRRMLYISNNGRIYMISNSMGIIFTGTMTNEKTLYNSLLDGEHILYDKMGKFINLYAAFDIYYVNGISVRELAFMKIDGQEEDLDNKYRLLLLHRCIRLIKPYSVLDSSIKKDDKALPGDKVEVNHACEFVIECKNFYSTNDGVSIFQACSKILSDIENGIYQYNTDGLIFTPSNTGVGSDRVGMAGKLQKTGWELSFKWKPPHYNTIDFLVSVMKNKEGKDDVHTIFETGLNVTSSQKLLQYKTLILRCGFNEKQHGYLNPYQNIIDDVIKTPSDTGYEVKYKPVPFQPTSPEDPKACLSNIMLNETGDGTLIMKTEEGDLFEEDMIVEFSYNNSGDEGWKWTPLRVRYDKTNELRSGRPNYGNSYPLANSIWKSIHNPVTSEMITTGTKIPEIEQDEEIYYNRRKKESDTKPLRNFHKLYVKSKLIKGVCHRNNILIDFAVGKAVDLPRWRENHLKFVFGIDYAKNNIHDNLNGACARYLTERKKYEDMPSAIFTVGNSALNVRDGTAFSSDKDKMIAKAVFGNGPKDRKILGEGIYKHYSIAKDGFNVASCQFALHYFFENPKVFHGFMRNLSECLRIDGYFIGTCYDGKTVFNLLKSKLKEESVVFMKNENKICEITKMYDETGFPDDENSIGYPILVYQETINKVFREYLVNFNYLTQIMEDYGFILVQKQEANKMGLPNGSGLFSELFTHMQNEIKRDPKLKDDYGDSIDLSDAEKGISFLNRYFVFRKVRDVHAKKLEDIISNNQNEMEKIEDEYEETKDVLKLSKSVIKTEEKKEETIEEQTKPTIKRKIKKIKLVINEYSPIVESPEPVPEPKPEPKPEVAKEAPIIIKKIKKPKLVIKDEK